MRFTSKTGRDHGRIVARQMCRPKKSASVACLGGRRSRRGGGLPPVSARRGTWLIGNGVGGERSNWRSDGSVDHLNHRVRRHVFGFLEEGKPRLHLIKIH